MPKTNVAPHRELAILLFRCDCGGPALASIFGESGNRLPQPKLLSTSYEPFCPQCGKTTSRTGTSAVQHLWVDWNSEKDSDANSASTGKGRPKR